MNILIILTNVSQMNTVAPSPLERVGVRSVGIANASRKEIIIIAIFYITSFIIPTISAKRFGTAKRNFQGYNLRFGDFVI